MESLVKNIRETAARLLSEKKVDVVIGFSAGTIPLRSMPYFARTPEEAQNLTWDSNCRMNLANFLPKRKDKIAVVAKGCDARNIVNHIVENQISREQVYIIGVPCAGMIDPSLIDGVDGGEIIEAVENNGRITIKSRVGETVVERESVLRQSCTVCQYPSPPIHDEMIAEADAEAEKPDQYADIRELAEKGDDERYAYFQELVAGCIRCYACRDACPLCYCPVCFVDEAQPQWVGKSVNDQDTMTYHLLRAFHCAGRCTDCGACESACPLDIKLRQFTRRLEMDVKDLYDYEAGLSLEDKPPLTVYQPDDPEDFIK